MIGATHWDPLPDPGRDVTPAEIRDAGRWEVVVTGSPPEAVTNDDETDWLYTWVED